MPVCYPGEALYPATDYLIYLSILVFLVVVLAWFVLPFKAFVWSMITKKPVLGILDKRGVITFVNKTLKNQTYQKKGEADKWIKDYHGTYRVAGCSTEIAHADNAFIKSAIAAGVFGELEERGYHDIDDVMTDVRTGKFDKLSWVNESGERVPGLIMPLLFIVPWEKVEQFGKQKIPPAALEGLVHEMAFEYRQKPSDASPLISKDMVIILAVLIIVGALAYVMITGGGLANVAIPKLPGMP